MNRRFGSFERVIQEAFPLFTQSVNSVFLESLLQRQIFSIPSKFFENSEDCLFFPIQRFHGGEFIFLLITYFKFILDLFLFDIKTVVHINKLI